jgi:hypothetical protein
MSAQSETLQRARDRAGLTVADLWFRYFSLGGMSTPLEVDAILHGALVPSDFDYDILAHAINERFLEQGGDHPVPYSDPDA